MDFNIKRHNLSLSDEEAPFYRFINSRKSLQDIYNNNKGHITVQNLNKIRYYSNDKKVKKIKKDDLKGHSVNLLKGQIFIISHFSNFAKRNKGNDINYNYNSSLLNTFGNRNFFKKNNIKVNMLSKLSNGNHFLKTSFKKRINPNKKQKISPDKINLPKLNFIIKKTSKNINL